MTRVADCGGARTRDLSLRGGQRGALGVDLRGDGGDLASLGGDEHDPRGADNDQRSHERNDQSVRNPHRVTPTACWLAAVWPTGVLVPDDVETVWPPPVEPFGALVFGTV